MISAKSNKIRSIKKLNYNLIINLKLTKEISRLVFKV